MSFCLLSSWGSLNEELEPTPLFIQLSSQDIYQSSCICIFNFSTFLLYLEPGWANIINLHHIHYPHLRLKMECKRKNQRQTSNRPTTISNLQSHPSNYYPPSLTPHLLRCRCKISHFSRIFPWGGSGVDSHNVHFSFHISPPHVLTNKFPLPVLYLICTGLLAC